MRLLIAVREPHPEHLHPEGRARGRQALEHRDPHVPGVSQFWKYSSEEFLKQPVYSREFPPCRHC